MKLRDIGNFFEYIKKNLAVEKARKKRLVVLRLEITNISMWLRQHCRKKGISLLPSLKLPINATFYDLR